MQPAAAGGVPSWLTALIAALGVVFGAVATGVASVTAANRKVREVEVSYNQRLQDTYLENARAYTNAVYVPIVVTLGHLSAAYDTFRVALVSGDSDAAFSAFRSSIDEFAEAIKSLLERGGGAFLTTALERELEVFLAFVASSRDSDSTTKRAILSMNTFGFNLVRETESELLIRQFRLLQFFRSLPFMAWVRFRVIEERTVAASVDSEEFDTEFSRTVSSLRILIKEVTLGAQARH